MKVELLNSCIGKAVLNTGSNILSPHHRLQTIFQGIASLKLRTGHLRKPEGLKKHETNDIRTSIISLGRISLYAS